jgi:hydroxymethylpyrimidine/phosphomethylpyrimidine kinase
MTPVALTIAGSDPSGGAGLQADLKTFHRFGVYGEAVPSLITVQNTRGVERIVSLDAGLVAAQIRAVVADIPPGAAKTGALGSREVIEAIAAEARSFAFPLVADPILCSTSGMDFLDDRALRVFMDQLVPRAYLLTPNLEESARLTGVAVDRRESMLEAARKLLALGAKNVLVKGGHLAGEALDILVCGDGSIHEFTAPRIETAHTHGSGCTYSAAITAELAKGAPLTEAVGRAKQFVTEAIRTNPRLGHGRGPLNHWA